MEWYKLEIEKILNEVKGSLNGLSNEEAKKRIEKYGLNELPKKKKDGPLKIFLSEYLFSNSITCGLLWAL